MPTTSRNKNVAGVGESSMPKGAKSDPIGKGHGNKIVTDMGKHGNAQLSGTPNKRR
jgi:hypothetical protein